MGLQFSNLNVAYILSPFGKTWNVSIIANMFYGTIVQRILNTPIYSTVTMDKRIWKANKNGVYSIRSAYKLYIHDLIDIPVVGQWKLIWFLSVPPKVKNLIWHIYWKCIPNREKLKDCDVNCPRDCVLCNDGVEQNLHVFFTCSNNFHIWKMSSFHPIIQQVVPSHRIPVSSVIFEVLRKLPTTKVLQFTTIIKYLEATQ